MLLLSSAGFCQNSLFQKIISGTLPVSKSLEKIRTNVFFSHDLGSKLFAKVISRQQKVAPIKERFKIV